MKIWYGINDAEDAIYALIMAGALCTMLWCIYRLARPVSRDPEPIPQGIYGVVVCNVDTPINSGDVITFNLTHHLEKSHAE